jgi:hypothetical protein
MLHTSLINNHKKLRGYIFLIYAMVRSPPPVSILSQPNPVHTPTSHFLKIHPNIILPHMPGSPQWSHPHHNPIRATGPAHLILLDFITRTILSEEYNYKTILKVLLMVC